MKMREFMTAIDKTIDLLEAEKKIVEKEVNLTESPIPQDWRLHKTFGEIERALNLLRSRINTFEQLYKEDAPSFDDKTAINWHYAKEDLGQLKAVLQKTDL